MADSSHSELSAMLKRYQRRSTRWYRYLSPPLPLVQNPHEQLLPPGEGLPCLMIGGAAQHPPDGFINLDIVAAPGVRVVADATHLPFSDNQFSRIECDAVLEHVREPAGVVREMFRTLMPAGFVHVVVPFNHPYHAYPHDYQRWTQVGLESLLSSFDIVSSGVRTGPAATWLLVTLQFIKVAFPGTLGKILGALAGWCLWPVRYLDGLLYRTDRAHILANSIYVLARKPTQGAASR